tara:strand:- start:467 stop:1570 length:1104 start_codon:yes stop_codon:yes gene_type:complete
MNNTILIIAGEASGDLHGAGLMKEMLAIDKSINFVGLGGPKMEKLGLQSLAPMNKLAVMGFWEVAKKILFFLKLKKQVLQTIRSTTPNKIILIDYPGFNLNIAKNIKKQFTIPVFYYISPQLWAWKEKRVEMVRQYVDHMIVVFPFEKPWYKNKGIDVQYFGHPIMEAQKNYIYKPLDYSGTTRIALCPGSRMQEIDRHMPIIKQFIKGYPDNNQNVNFTIIRAPGITKKALLPYLKGLKVSIEKGPILEVLQGCHFGVIASGTAALEGAITTRPILVVYKMSWISWFITRRFVTIPFACIVNILANKKIIPELLQDDFTVNNIIKTVNIYKEKEARKNYVIEINNIINKLGDGSAYYKTAKYIINQ